MKKAKSENDGGESEPYLSAANIRTFVKKQLTSKPETQTISMDQTDPKPHKKQVRRRLQTRKPYQEKLLNMAEARREIVTALKLHRAAMKQATQNQIQPDFQTDQKSRRNPRIYASNNFSDNPVYPWPVSPAPPPPPPAAAFFEEGFDFQLPSQALGLNLNLQDFIAASSSSIYSSSPSTSSSPPPPAVAEVAAGGDEKFEYLNCVGEDEREEELASSPFDEVMEFPPWLNANESCFYHLPDCFQEPVLPCMEIEEIDGMDGDWLA